MCLKFGFICLFFASSAFAAPRDSSKVSVSVLIGIVDPDSLKYMNTQVQDVENAIRDFVDIKYLPLGLINSTGNGLWHCPGGEVECELDRANICIIKKETEYVQLKFWACESYAFAMWPKPDPFNLDDLETLLKTCSETYVADFDKITECRKGEESTQYLKEHEKFLNENGINKLPAVWFNDKYDKELDVAAQKNLLSTVCSFLKPKPIRCFT